MHRHCDHAFPAVHGHQRGHLLQPPVLLRPGQRQLGVPGEHLHHRGRECPGHPGRPAACGSCGTPLSSPGRCCSVTAFLGCLGLAQGSVGKNTCILGAVNILATLVGLLLVDCVGGRFLLLAGAVSDLPCLIQGWCVGTCRMAGECMPKSRLFAARIHESLGLKQSQMHEWLLVPAAQSAAVSLR